MRRIGVILLGLSVAALGWLGSADPAWAAPFSSSSGAAQEMKAFVAMTRQAGAGKPLAGVHVLGRQHLEGATRALTEALIDAGVDPQHISLLGKSYSEHAETVKDLHEMKIHTQTTGQGFRLGHAVFGVARFSEGTSTTDRLEMQLQRELARIPDDGSKILVIDDGGELVHMLHERFPQLLPRVVAVEQTRRGARLLEKMGDQLKIPVIDVAQSDAKLKYESPMIGRSVARNAQRKLDELKAQGITTGKRVLLIGYGAVGAATARSFREAGYEVGAWDKAWDENPAAREAARAAGVQAYESKEAALGDADLIVSATGETALGPRELEHVKSGAILMNAASEQREIVASPDQRTDKNVTTRALRLYSRFGGKTIDIGDARMPSRMNIVLHTQSGRELLLLNDGFVVNFDNQAHPTPARYIQLTMGLLYHAALQAVGLSTRTAGLKKLDGEKQKIWIGEVQRDLATRGESLEHPTF